MLTDIKITQNCYNLDLQFTLLTIKCGARGGAEGWGTGLQDGKVAGSIPDGVIGIFHWHNRSGRTGVDLASNRNEYQEYFLGGKGGRCVGLITLTTFMCQLSWNLWASATWKLQGLSRPVMGLLYLFFYFLSVKNVVATRCLNLLCY